ncbi:hypothetical protein [Sinorhizobium fredii]|uniref:hypothetical protein n=1 Tax=Rhizobium fredii TaxID=380 RepID=UPI0035132990
MHRTIVAKVVGLLCGGWCFLILVAPVQLRAQDSTAPISISIADKINPVLTPLVYVDGVLAGAIDGTVRVPVAAESKIEIGLPQARQPLYSLALGPKQFESKAAAVVMTSYSYMKESSGDFWDAINLEPNTIENIQLEPGSAGGFKIKLPAHSYESYEEIIRKLGVDRSSKDWLEAIPEANDKSRAKGISHLTTATNATGSWSGTYSIPIRNSWPPPGYSEREWKISSEPVGAKIMTQVGDKGLTNSTVQLPDLSETFVVLQLAGYLDCPHSGEQCTLTDGGAFIELHCTLKRK